MKKLGIAMLIFVSLISGCSFGDNVMTFANHAESLADELDTTLAYLKKMEKKEDLDSEEQQKLNEMLEGFCASMEVVIDTYPKNMVGKKVFKGKSETIIATLKKVQEKAKNGNATTEDITEARDALHENITIFEIF